MTLVSLLLQAAPVETDSGWFKALVIFVGVIALAALLYALAFIGNVLAGRHPPNP